MPHSSSFIAVVGLGGLVQTYGSEFEAANLFGLRPVILAVAVSATSIVGLVERKLTAWTG